MLKQAMEYLIGLSKPNISEFYGEAYTDKEMYRVGRYVPMAEPIEIGTLTGLVDYIKSNTDSMSESMIIEVSSPRSVKLYSSLNEQRQREKLIEVYAEVPDFPFDCFMDQERFCIGLQSKFIKNTDRELLLKFAGTVESGTVAKYGDDGVSQKATIKTGLASKAEAIVPSPVKLMPYRTFPEAEQPASDFIFRMRESGGVQCAIFEADGGAWKSEAMKNVKAYLEKELADRSNQFTIIA